MSAAANPVDLDALKGRIATALGWSRRDVDGFSLPTLRELLRPKHAKLADEVTGVVQRGEHLVEPAAPRAPARRRR